MPAQVETNRTPPLSIRLKADQKARFAAIAKAQDRSVHALAIRAITEYIEKAEARLEFMQEGDEALKHYETTGLHLTHEELVAWSGNLYTEKEQSIPQCHD